MLVILWCILVPRLTTLSQWELPSILLSSTTDRWILKYQSLGRSEALEAISPIKSSHGIDLEDIIHAGYRFGS